MTLTTALKNILKIGTGWMLFSGRYPAKMPSNDQRRCRCRRRRHLDRKNRRLASLPSNHFESEVITLTAKNTGMGEDERKLPREFLAFFFAFRTRIHV